MIPLDWANCNTIRVTLPAIWYIVHRGNNFKYHINVKCKFRRKDRTFKLFRNKLCTVHRVVAAVKAWKRCICECCDLIAENCNGFINI